MVNKVGKWLLWVLCITGTLYANVKFEAVNSEHLPLVQAGIGHPFLLELTLPDVYSVGPHPSVQGLEHFMVKPSGVYLETTNNKSTALYTFELRSDREGTYTLGPTVKLPHDSPYTVVPITVKVGAEEQIAGTKSAPAKVLLRLSTDKKEVMVGERLHCWLQFYYTDPAIPAPHIFGQDVKDFIHKQPRDQVTGTEHINGIEYQYLAWEWDMVPQAAGTYVIPAYGADYEYPVAPNQNPWGLFAQFLGNHRAIKRLYSNAVPVRVIPLPPAVKPVQIIGVCKSITLQAKPPIARQAEGIVVTVEITADADPDAMQFAGLEGMPEELRFYTSQQSVEEDNEHRLVKKRYEFVVQGLKVGSWEIPAQSVYCFDTKKRAYVTLTSTPVTLTIMADAKKAKNSKKKEEPLPESAAPRLASLSDIAPLATEGWVYKGSVDGNRGSWWWFWVVVVLPALVLALHALYQAVRVHRMQKYPHRRARTAFAVAKKRLATMARHHNEQGLYTLFIELFADRWQESITTLSSAIVHTRLAQCGMRAEELQAWDTFFTAIAERSFGAPRDANNTTLFEQAKQWLERLEMLV
jgi:hypothetical protein